MTTIKDIAQALNISTATVSKALNGKGSISEQMTKNIIQEAVKLGYKGAVMKFAEPIEKKTIGVILPQRFLQQENLNHDFYLSLFQLISVEFSKHGYYTILHTLSEQDEDELILPKMIIDSRVDAVVCIADLRYNYLKFIEKISLPLLLMDFYDKDNNCDSIVSDNTTGMYKLTKMLIEAGHKKIGFMGRLGATTSIQDRYIGYIKALIENNLTENKMWTIDDRDERGVYYRNVQLPQELPTAFVCNSDRAAFELVKTLKRKGINVPKDVSVVGFDNDVYSVTSSPMITTIAVDKKAMAISAVDYVLKKLKDKTYTVKKVMIEGNLIERESIFKI